MRRLSAPASLLRLVLTATSAVFGAAFPGAGCDSLGDPATLADEADDALVLQPIAVLKPNFLLKLAPGGTCGSAQCGQVIISNSGTASVLTKLEWAANPYAPLATWTKAPLWSPTLAQLQACAKSAAPFTPTGVVEGGSYTDVLAGRTTMNTELKSGGPAYVQNVTLFYYIGTNHPLNCGPFSKLASNGQIPVPNETVTLKLTHSEFGTTSVTTFTCNYKQATGDLACATP